MAKNNVLTDSQKKNLINSIKKIFIEETTQITGLRIEEFRKKITIILKALDLEEIKHSNGTRKGWEIKNLTRRRQSLALQGYMLIMNFRAYLTGQNIDYRYYWTDTQGNTYMQSFGEHQLINFVKFGKQAIELDFTELKKKSSINSIMDKYFRLYTVPDVNDYMRLASNKYGRVVRSRIMKLYEHSNPGLRKKGTNNYQMFNRGHIYEAIDIAQSELGLEQKKITDNLMQNYVFGRHLALDNIKASQGPDNPFTNTSIKSGGADLYDYYTIKNQLEKILTMLDENKNAEERRDAIKQVFLSKQWYDNISSSQIEKAIEQDAQNILEKIIQDLTN